MKVCHLPWFGVLKIHWFSHNFPFKWLVIILKILGQYGQWRVINFLFQIQCKIRHWVVKNDTPCIYSTPNQFYFSACDLPNSDLYLYKWCDIFFIKKFQNWLTHEKLITPHLTSFLMGNTKSNVKSPIWNALGEREREREMIMPNVILFKFHML